MSKPLRIMVVDDDERRGAALAEALTACGYAIVGRGHAGDYLPTLVADAKPDMLLIDTHSPTRDTLNQLAAIHRDQPCPVVMFSMDDEGKTIERAVRAGVSAYIVDGLSHARIKPIIDVALAQFRQYQQVVTELDRTRTSLAERRDVERAKEILVRRTGCNENEAFARLRKMAMDRKKRLGVIARDVIDMADLLPPASRPAPANAAHR